MKRVLVCGAAGFIGTHLVRRLRNDGCHVVGVDIESTTGVNLCVDLREPEGAYDAMYLNRPFDEVYQLAADMGGAGFVFTGANDAAIMRNSALINLNMADTCVRNGVRVLFTSSACVYADDCAESSAYPANPDSEYGWEKLFSERMWQACARNHGLEVRIARLHNIFGPEGAWNDGREKAPAALCRKIAEAPDGGTIEIWGDGEQTRSFLYIDECVEGLIRLMRSDVREPLNIGSERSISINELAYLIADIAGKRVHLNHIEGPQGVRGRVSDNRRIRELLGWAPAERLAEGLTETYAWIAGQVEARKAA